MATSIKGGLLIVDFKDEDKITNDPSNPTQLKQDFYSKLLESKGKIIMLINGSDDFGYLGDKTVSVCPYVYYGDNYVAFEFSNHYFRISEDNKMYEEEM